MKKTLANGVTREPLPAVCFVCGFEVPRHLAVKRTLMPNAPVPTTLWRHKEFKLCERLTDQRRLSDKLLGRSHR